MKTVAVVPSQPINPVSADKTTGGAAVTSPVAAPAAPQPSGSPVNR